MPAHRRDERNDYKRMAKLPKHARKILDSALRSNAEMPGTGLTPAFPR